MRMRAGATTVELSTPLVWSEVDDRRLTARRFTIRDIGDRLSGGDPWQGIGRQARSLTRARNRLAKLIG